MKFLLPVKIRRSVFVYLYISEVQNMENIMF